MSDIVERLRRTHTTGWAAEAAAEIERLRARLEPFAKMADQLDEWEKGTRHFTGHFDANDLRRARAALTTTPPPETC